MIAAREQGTVRVRSCHPLKWVGRDSRRAIRSVRERIR